MTSRCTAPRRRTVSLLWTVVVALLLLCFVGPMRWVLGSQALAQAKQPLVRAKIADVSWIQGRWGTQFGDNELEEIWSPPAGDCMMASFRWLKGDKIWMYELLTMVEEESTLVLRFKHFSPELHGWEEKDEALTLTLAALDSDFAAFRNTGDDGPKWMIFHKESPKRLTIRVGKKREKNQEDLEIKYEKKD